MKATHSAVQSNMKRGTIATMPTDVQVLLSTSESQLSLLRQQISCRAIGSDETLFLAETTFDSFVG